MQFTYQELVDRAKVWVDDDHNDVKGWIKDDKWLAIAYSEVRKLYRQMIKFSMVRPDAVDEVFILSPSSIPPMVHQLQSGAIAVVGVAELKNGEYRPLTHRQSAFGSYAWQGTSSTNAGPASTWFMTMTTGDSAKTGDVPSIHLDPLDTSGTYVVRYIPSLPKPTSLNDTVEIFSDADELLVCNIARAAHTKDSTVSAALEKRRLEEEAAFNFARFGISGDSPRVRRVRPTERHRRFGFPLDPAAWIYR